MMNDAREKKPDTLLYHYPSSSLWKIPDRHVVLEATSTLRVDPRSKTPDAGRDGPVEK